MVFDLQLQVNAIYNLNVGSTQGSEKEHRGDLRSQVQKHISKDTIVILDSLNYIKGRSGE